MSQHRFFFFGADGKIFFPLPPPHCFFPFTDDVIVSDYCAMSAKGPFGPPIWTRWTRTRPLGSRIPDALPCDVSYLPIQRNLYGIVSCLIRPTVDPSARLVAINPAAPLWQSLPAWLKTKRPFCHTVRKNMSTDCCPERFRGGDHQDRSRCHVAAFFATCYAGLQFGKMVGQLGDAAVSHSSRALSSNPQRRRRGPEPHRRAGTAA